VVLEKLALIDKVEDFFEAIEGETSPSPKG